MSIEYRSEGSLFDSGAQALVNCVNCRGTMGKGIALEFKRRFPAMFEGYKKFSDAGAYRPGCITYWQQPNGPLIVNFFTKDDWRRPSKIEWIDSGLFDLVNTLSHYEVTSIALPPLGCGNGGLDWNKVKPIMHEALSKLEDIEVIIYEPRTMAS